MSRLARTMIIGTLTSLAILVAGFAATGPFMVFSMILSQGGHPKQYSVLMSIILAANITFNLVGIHAFGIVGAAAATSLSFIVGVVALVGMTRRTLGLELKPW